MNNYLKENKNLRKKEDKIKKNCRLQIQKKKTNFGKLEFKK
jgi:hypothetical protein